MSFQWFEKEDQRKAYRASVGRDGKLRLGKPLRQVLPRDIQVGFDRKTKVLAIADGHGFGLEWPSGGVITMSALSAQLLGMGLQLPVAFRLTADETTGFWLGRIAPRRRRSKEKGGLGYDVEQLLVVYHHLLDSGIQQIARTTPLAERKAIALSAFYEAVDAYRPGYRALETYLETRIRERLLRENKQFTQAYGQYSLDTPLTEGEEDFCLYDMVADADGGGLDQLEDRIMEEEFSQSLSREESRLFRMVREGCRVEEIARELGMDAARILELGEQIGQKRQAFYSLA